MSTVVLTKEGGDSEWQHVDLCGCHGDVEQVVRHDRGQAEQNEQFPALLLDGLIYDLPFPPLAFDQHRHRILNQIPTSEGSECTSNLKLQ